MFATRPALVAAFLATSAVATVAHADGPPGTCDCAVTAAPVAAPAAPSRALPRWGLGLHLQSLTIADPAAMDGEGTPYGGGGLQVRYRLSPRWQLELAAGHVTEQDVDEAVARHLDTVALSAQYHPRPFARWDLYLVAGLGATSDGDPDATDEAKEASRIGDVQLGVGVERRFGRIGVGAELRAVFQAEPEPDDAALMTTGDDERARGAGKLALGATYYF